MQATITLGATTVELHAVRLADRRVAATVPPELAEVLTAQDSVTVELLVVEADGRRHETPASASIVRSGRAWTEARGRLREERGWAYRFARSPAEVVVLTPTD